MTTNYKKIADFFFELGLLKRQKHTGPLLAGVNDLTSLADHTVRTATIAYLLADLENVNPEKTCIMCLIHDFPEIRTGDHHKVSARYIDTGPAEKKAFLEQISALPNKTRDTWLKLYHEKNKRNTKEGVIAQDADWLETAVSAKEFIEQGYPAMQNWIDNVRKALETPSAKEILKVIEKSSSTDWWQGLKKMTYKKLKK
ncbi:MAG: HD domain-containing protein [Patescibacteria group bacterium]